MSAGPISNDDCDCPACRRRRAEWAGEHIPCNACKGTGTVLSILGDMRPCSLCRPDDFNQWCRERKTDDATRHS